MTQNIEKLPIKTTPEIDFDLRAAGYFGASLAQKYANGEPFPHIVIDDFLPKDLIASICSHFPDEAVDEEMLYERGYKGQNKRQINPNQCDPFLRQVFNVFNSAPMLNFLEELTGIEGLIPDPYFAGGGLHETKSGGFLGVHSDFRLNKKLNIERRLNVIIYLNRDWLLEYGGNLELWDAGMRQCIKKIHPIYNRGVIFNTDKDSNHGHPTPLSTPPDISRRSLALYYYTALKGSLDPTQRNKTHYKPRPSDRISLKYYWTKLFKKKP
ncbi:2OG-Fe(II) oxygenase [Pseudomonas sp. NPDC098747]|uniref:2OG-Fe(II) oxygenase n=1 Tax=Pseudomonas sp. NPDC098747 TaxID=3364487 RepID=UPI00383A5FE3